MGVIDEDFFGRFMAVWWAVMLDENGVSDTAYDKLISLGRMCVPPGELAYMRREVRHVPGSDPPRFYVPKLDRLSGRRGEQCAPTEG